MHIRKLHKDEPDIDLALIPRLLAGQMPQWADLPLHLVESIGTDNVMIRLGRSLVIRMPRTPVAAQGITKEQALVPRLAPQLPVPVPLPVGVGEAAFGYPWRWSVYPWFAGRNPLPGIADDHLAIQLADFVCSLRRIDTFGLRPVGPLHSYRAESIARRDCATRATRATRASIAACDGLVDAALTEAVWEKTRDVIDYAGPPVWMHSDLHPGNILVRGGRLSAVIDWGGLSLGDPAIDCLVAWTLLTPNTRRVFRAHADVDEDTWKRGRAWALSIALVALPYYRDMNEQITAWAKHAIVQVIGDIVPEL
ncbi:aminoglycoside phosphotransferase family protein [Rhodococcus sp. KBS0724]|jgi:aminoglycoside phosphotransferase (APT) family kinase protein|uniref:aminoglycoside phosphotransferase family protein n=1 Tax=Rhodococcus sp. KBS0724 TaxID=1179674 RepID=UPI00110F5A89|nr:aminoglycoside phosphotransferase family protein [Rhodococcus sp. KBS0724]TSD47097.1 aminoglycoside phosphotransferase family protein [Rhodococcus sp. KBS0724]